MSNALNRRRIIEQLAERFMYGKRGSWQRGEYSSGYPAFAVAFDDQWVSRAERNVYGRPRSRVEQLVETMPEGAMVCFHGVSGTPGWEEIVQEFRRGVERMNAFLAPFEEGRPLPRRLTGCAEAKILCKIFHFDKDPANYVIGSYDVHGKKPKLRDPCPNCQTWVFSSYAEVVCHATQRPR